MEKKTVRTSTSYTILGDNDNAISEASLLQYINEAKEKAQEYGTIKTMSFEVHTYGDYDSSSSGELELQITTERPETAEEFMARTTRQSKQAATKAKNIALRAERQRTKDLEQLATLKMKYE